MFLLGILIFKGLTAERLYKSFGVKGLMSLLDRISMVLNGEMWLGYASVNTIKL
jgi:hypothetical protein